MTGRQRPTTIGTAIEHDSTRRGTLRRPSRRASDLISPERDAGTGRVSSRTSRCNVSQAPTKRMDMSEIPSAQAARTHVSGSGPAIEESGTAEPPETSTIVRLRSR